MIESLGVVRLNMCGISLLGVVGLNKYCPYLLPSTSCLNFLRLFPTSLPTVTLLPSGAFYLYFLHTTFSNREPYVLYYPTNHEILGQLY